MSAEDVLDELQSMEGKYVFQCNYCAEIFETVMEIGLHSLEQHPGRWIGIEPIRKQ
jgi:hypothetical protein